MLGRFVLREESNQWFYRITVGPHSSGHPGLRTPGITYSGDPLPLLLVTDLGLTQVTVLPPPPRQARP